MSGDDGAPPTGVWQFSGRTAMVTGAASGIDASFVTGQVLHVNGGCVMP